jgi:hypothetical protein
MPFTGGDRALRPLSAAAGALVAVIIGELYSTYFHMPGISGSFSIINGCHFGWRCVRGGRKRLWRARRAQVRRPIPSMHPLPAKRQAILLSG